MRPEGIGAFQFTSEVIMNIVMNNSCANSGDFKKYFDENMRALGLPVPASLFETFERSIAAAVVLVSTLNALGSNATMAELMGATVMLEKLGVVGSIGAAFYVGAVIGSIFVASGQVAMCGNSFADLAAFLLRYDLAFAGWNTFFVHNPQVLDTQHPCRQSFGLHAHSTTASLRCT